MTIDFYNNRNVMQDASYQIKNQKETTGFV